MKHYPLEKKFKSMLENAGISVHEVLSHAGLPEDLFDAPTPVVTTEGYYHFMDAVDSFHPKDELILQLTTADQIETFSPPVFAAYCSKDALSFLKRMAEYETLYCSIELVITEEDNTITMEIKSPNASLKVPRLIVLIKMIFILHLLRKATNRRITPIEFTSWYHLNSEVYQNFFGTDLKQGEKNIIVFQKSDMLLRLESENESMWNYFLPELNRRREELEVDESFSAQVRSCLMDLLASGDNNISDVASKLCVSVRTLQRKLQAEGTNFQQQLNHTRELLAKNYIRDHRLTAEEIAFLLGYQDVSSFQRAFLMWTGMSVSDYRNLA